ncbi:two-component regulator propeller domain-containing protein [Fodinibius sp. SL11]|uniref:two-component regulator propeller domain-containing protein n=1 Tax=Fodinibius sp. SL11 TaxID=3425690 RepID=UPI003F883C14
MKKNKKLYRSFFLGVLFLVTTVMILACRSTADKNINAGQAQSDSVSPPVIIEAKKFVTIYLDSLPPPKVVNISEKIPPTTTDAGFYVTMQNFNTEDGLALSSLICGYKDRAGNLWFGTSGNGASMYNGKSFTNYFSSHGLIHNFINTITEDSKGNIWFGTYGGVSKYDGVTFENFSTAHGLIDNDVRKILEDSKGNIWLATKNGVSRYSSPNKDSAQGSFVNYDTNDGLAAGAVIYIMEDRNGNIWFGSGGGISKYDRTAEASGKKAFQDLSESMGVSGRIVHTITEDKEGIIWIGTNDLLSRYEYAKEGKTENMFTHFTVDDGLAGNSVISSMEGSDGNLWFGTKTGVSNYSKADSTFLNFTTEQGLAHNQVESITEDKSGSLWFGTYGGGLSKYDGKSVVEYSSEQGLPGKAVYAITEDNKGNFWLAPLDGGIVEYRRAGSGKMGGTFINYTTEQGFNETTAYTSLEDNSGNLWFGTSSGLFKYDGSSFTEYTSAQGLRDDYINALSTDREGNLWIGTFDGGVSKFDGKSFTNFSTGQGLVHKTVWNIFEDKDGIIWIATRGGLSRFDGKQFMNFTKAQGLSDNKLSTLMQDSQGNLFTAGWGGGVSIIRKRHLEKLSEPDIEQNYENIFEHFSTAEGLANDVVYNIVEDSTGNLIIGTSYGFTILNGGIGTEGGKIAKNGIENYNEKTGYPIKDVSHIYSLFKDSREFIWAGTGDKLVRFDYNSVHKSKQVPTVYIQNVKINNETISWHSLDWAQKNDQPLKQNTNNVPAYVIDELRAFDRTLTTSERDTLAIRFKNVRFDGIRPFSAIPENLVLPYRKNNITFDFIGIETARPHLVRYRYKLGGNDEEWSPVTDKATASFGNIFEGSYNFMVQAQSPDGIWSEPLIYSFKILPPWYRYWIAYLFYILVFMGGVYFVHRVQKARTIRNEREKIQQRELEQAKKIEKAYRELEIEAALERVRSTSMAMRHTSELQGVVNTVAEQLKKINMNINGGVFIVINDEVDRNVPIWGSGGAADYAKKAVVPFLDRPIFKCLRDAIKEEKDFLVEKYSKEEKGEFFEHLFKHQPWRSVPEEMKKQLLSLPGGYTRSVTISQNTSIFIINNTGERFSNKDNEILKRFGKIFEQSYIRFLDLQKAEAHSQEVMKQASLDRVRGEISSMRSSEDLQQIIPVIWRELTAIGIPFFRCGVCILDDHESTIRFYLSASDGHLLSILNFPFGANSFTANVAHHWRNGTVYKEHWDREDFIEWTKSMTEQGQIRDKKAYPGAEEPPESLYLHLIPFKQGMLYIGNKEPLTDNEITLSKSLAETFSIAYARYDDFNQLEQTKEKAEAALVELRAAQKQLVQQEKLASLGQLTAGIAHEIKNPLNFVNNFADLSIELIEEVKNALLDAKSFLKGEPIGISDRGDDRQYIVNILDDIETNLHKIHEHGKRADRIVKSMLQHSRGGIGTIEPTKLNSLLKEFVNLAFHGMRAGKDPMNVEIDMHLDDQLNEVPLIAEDFSRVIVNLCNNAFDAMRDKLSAAGDQQSAYQPKLTIRTGKKSAQAIVEIEDNGPGIPEKIRKKIMQPFFTTKKGIEGTGLGLYITNDIIQAHGGELEIESEPNVFTRFIIKIPMHPAV